MFSLFSLMNGDIINESYQDMGAINSFFWNLYLYTFIAMSVLVIQNVFIAIITDGYQISKYIALNIIFLKIRVEIDRICN